MDECVETLSPNRPNFIAEELAGSPDYKKDKHLPVTTYGVTFDVNFSTLMKGYRLSPGSLRFSRRNFFRI